MMSAEIFPSVLNVNDVLHFLSSYSQNIGLCSVQQEFFSDFFFLFCNEIYILCSHYHLTKLNVYCILVFRCLNFTTVDTHHSLLQLQH